MHSSPLTGPPSSGAGQGRERHHAAAAAAGMRPPLRGSDLLLLVCCLSSCGAGCSGLGGEDADLQGELLELLKECLLKCR